VGVFSFSLVFFAETGVLQSGFQGKRLTFLMNWWAMRFELYFQHYFSSIVRLKIDLFEQSPPKDIQRPYAKEIIDRGLSPAPTGGLEVCDNLRH
jgi:hypothetical protein